MFHLRCMIHIWSLQNYSKLKRCSKLHVCLKGFFWRSLRSISQTNVSRWRPLCVEQPPAALREPSGSPPADPAECATLGGGLKCALLCIVVIICFVRPCVRTPHGIDCSSLCGYNLSQKSSLCYVNHGVCGKTAGSK